MISVDQNPTHLLQPVEDRVDILFRELELAIKWQRPSILLAIYGPEAVHIDAVTRLKKNLFGLRQAVYHIQIKDKDISRIPSMVPADADLERTVFFVESFDWGGAQADANNYYAIDQFRDFFIKKRIRVVFWLTENDANRLAHYAPDFWTFRHCSVELIGSLEEKTTSDLEAARQSLGESPNMPEDADSRAGWNISSSVDLTDENQPEVTHLNLSLTLGILNWRRGDYEKATEFLQAALEIAETIQDKWFRALCFNSLALVQTSMGKIDEAIRSYESALDLTPEHIFPWSNLGNLYNKSDRHDKALGAFHKAITIDPKNAISWNGLGDVYVKLGKADDAIMAYQKAIEFVPNFANPWNGLGNVYASMGHTETAINAYQKTIELNRNLINPWICLGSIFYKQGRSDDALKTFRKAVELDPGNARIWNELGSIYFNAGDYVQAAAAYNKAIELDPGFGMPYCNLAFTYTHQGRYAEAIPLYQRSIELLDGDKDKAISWNRLGSTYRRLHEYYNTVAAYDTVDKPGTEPAALQENELNSQVAQPSGIHLPGDQELGAGSGIAGKRDDLDEQERSAIANLMVAPSIPGQVVALGEELSDKSRESGQVPTSVHTVEESVRRANNRDDSLAVDCMMGENKSRNLSRKAAWPKGMDEAVENSTIAPRIEDVPKNAHIWNEIGNVYFNSGAFDRAMAAFNKAIELDPEYGRPYGNLALAYSNHGRYPEAIPLYKKSIELLGSKEEKAVAWNGLGNAYRRLGDSDSAIVAYQLADRLDLDSGDTEKVLGEDPDQLDSTDPHAWNELGLVYTNTGACDRAIYAYRKAIELAPGFGWPYSNLALAFSHQGRYTEAIPLCRKSIELFGGDKEKAVSWNRLGDIYRHLNDRENAVVAYQNAVELDPENVTLLTRARFSLLSNCYVG